MAQDLTTLIARLEAATAKLEELSGSVKPSVGPDGKTPPWIAAFDELLAGPFQLYLDLSQKVGGAVAEQAVKVKEGLNVTKTLLCTAVSSKKPDQKGLQEIITPLQNKIQEVILIKDKNRPSPLFFHLSSVADGIGALGWVVVVITPVSQFRN